MSVQYVYPTVNGKRLIDSTRFKVSKNYALVSFFLTEDNVAMFGELSKGGEFRLGYELSNGAQGDLFHSARASVLEVDDGVDKFSYVTVAFVYIGQFSQERKQLDRDISAAMSELVLNRDEGQPL